jgi:16S rRNA G966 N2-methylase RsmD
MAAEHSVTTYHGLELAWSQELSGGGRGFGQYFIPLVDHLFGPVGRLFEFCAGPGYIGFALLARGLCDHLVLSDSNPRAVELARETVRLNGLEDRVTIYESDGLADIPADERWDLVVANPPHFPGHVEKSPRLVLDDPGWQLHRRFFERVGDFLLPGASVVLVENSEGASPGEFLDMIAAAGLFHVRTLWYTGGASAAHLYFLWIKKSLPGLVLEDGYQTIALPLRDDAEAAVTAPAGRPVELRLVNETGRTVRPRMVDETGKDVLWRRLPELAAAGAAALPVVALRSGDFEVRDRPGDATIARLRAR